MLLSLGLGAVVLAATPWALPFLFGTAFGPAVPATLVLILASVVAAFNGVVEEGFRGLGKPSVVLWAEVAGLGVTATALLLLLPTLGILGAALASLLGYTGVTLALFTQAIKTGSVPSWRGFCPTREDLGAAWARLASAVGRAAGLRTAKTAR